VIKKFRTNSTIDRVGCSPPDLFVHCSLYHQLTEHKLSELNKIIEETIGSLKEEVQVGTNVKLNPLYVADRRDESELMRFHRQISIQTVPKYARQEYTRRFELYQRFLYFRVISQICL
jgi:hypothetical protein